MRPVKQKPIRLGPAKCPYCNRDIGGTYVHLDGVKYHPYCANLQSGKGEQYR